MPTSDPSMISPVCEKIKALQPKRVLDIGIGFGKWGALTREYTDIWSWRFYQHEWTTWIEGIEPHVQYRSPNWSMYNHIHGCKVNDILYSLGKYDLIIFLEVLEHIEKPEGLKLLADLMLHTSNLIVSFCNNDQRDVRDNKLEDHVSKWNTSDFDFLGHIDVINTNLDGAVLYITK